MKRFLFPIALIVLACAPAPAQADFGLKDLDVSITPQEGAAALDAGSHPLAMTTTIGVNTVEDPKLGTIPDGAAKDITVALPPGFVADPTAVPRCPSFIFLESIHGGAGCPDDTVIGKTTVEINAPGDFQSSPVYNLAPPRGQLAKFGLIVLDALVTLEVGLNPKPPHNGVVTVSNITQAVTFYSATTTIWGVPASPVHDGERGACLGIAEADCPVDTSERPLLTMPGSCEDPLATLFKADSWQNPGVFQESAVLAHGEGEEGAPPSGCSALLFKPTVAAQLTSQTASSPTGLGYSLGFQDQGLTSPTGRAQSETRKAVVTLPEGFTANPAVAAGLEGCSEADLERETATSEAGAGCPNASKIGSVEVESPLLEESVNGSVYVAKPYDNPFGSLLALYMVIRNSNLGILVTQPLKVETDPVTGRITTVAEELPQLPFSHFTLHFRQGARSPLATPPGCGSYDATSVLTPWSGGPPVESTSTFQITTGPEGGSCPSELPFAPKIVAGTLSNAAGRFSPFDLRLTRSDADQEISNFSVKMPPGLVAKLAGIPFCPEAAIQAARARTSRSGGQEELEHPSCPQASEVGHSLVGAGVGPSLTYAPGKVYLAGPYHGSPLSLVAITAAKVGPFDLGTVVVREALKIDPVTAEVSTDPANSDPLPRIIKGIPVHLRDIRVYVDRPEFTLNPTNCTPSSVASTLFGAGPSLASLAGGGSATVSTRFQAADCASLGFKPKISLSLTGGTKRSAHPALRAVLKTRPHDANASRIAVRLPHSEFLEQGHIRTVCTRVQFAGGAGNGAECPAGAVYGHARAWTPLLSEPLEGPVFLRSSSNPLPDLVLALHGLIDVQAVGRISSVNAGIANTFDFVPDAPVSKVVVNFEGGKKGLLVNSTNICRGSHKATVKFNGQNGRTYTLKPQLKAQCGGKKSGGKGKKRR